MMNINSKINQSGTNYCFKYVFLYFPTISCFTGFGNFCVFLSSQNHQFPDFQSTNPNYHVSTNWLAVSDNILFMADSYCCHVTVHKLWEGFPFCRAWHVQSVASQVPHSAPKKPQLIQRIFQVCRICMDPWPVPLNVPRASEISCGLRATLRCGGKASATSCGRF